jgi:hypothetical protein
MLKAFGSVTKGFIDTNEILEKLSFAPPRVVIGSCGIWQREELKSASLYGARKPILRCRAHSDSCDASQIGELKRGTKYIPPLASIVIYKCYV